MAKTLKTPQQPPNKKPPPLLWYSLGCAMLNLAVNTTVNKFGSSWPNGVILILWLAALIPFVVWAIKHERNLLNRNWIITRLKNHPVSMPAIVLLFSWVAYSQVTRIIVRLHTEASQTTSSQRGPRLPPSSPTAPYAPQNLSPVLPDSPKRKLAPEPTNNSQAIDKSHGAIQGSDNTLVGNVGNRTIVGDRNTIVGATDANGNTVLDRGGTAIGAGAVANPSSVAIGAHAGAGNPPSRPITRDEAIRAVEILAAEYEHDHPQADIDKEITWINARLKSEGYPFPLRRRPSSEPSPTADKDCPEGRSVIDNATADGSGMPSNVETTGFLFEGPNPCVTLTNSRSINNKKAYEFRTSPAVAPPVEQPH